MQTTGSDYYTQGAAAHAIDPERPPGADALRRWHDRIGGPRDTAGRRIFTAEVCEEIRRARQNPKAIRRA